VKQIHRSAVFDVWWIQLRHKRMGAPRSNHQSTQRKKTPFR